MIVAIHQPEHFPWIGFFEKMLRADVLVLLDDVQFSKGDYQNRTRIKGQRGAQWLTVPVVQKFPQKINEVEVAGNNWQAKHWKTLVSCYAKASHFEVFAGMFEDFYRQRWEKLADLNIAALELITSALGIEKKWVLTSQLATKGKKSDLVLNICQTLGASVYYAGRTGSTYLNQEAFQQAGIEIFVQNFNHPIYDQLFINEQGFVRGLSVLDFLFNCGAPALGEALIEQALPAGK